MSLRDQATAAYRYWRADHAFRAPLQVGFAVNNTCNTFCEMCNIWKMKPKSALPVDDIRRIFGNRLFRDCVTISLTGGEPSMRKDFHEIPKALVAVMPSLQRITVTSNGYATARIIAQYEDFLPVLAERDVDFSVNISMDGVGDVHNAVRNNKRAWGHLENTLDALQALKDRYRFNLVLACTLTKTNVDDAPNVLSYAKRRGLYVIFRNAFTIERIENLLDFPTFALSESQLQAVQEFYEELVADYDPTVARREYYRMLLAMMQGAERSIPCLYRKAGLFVDHLGDMYVCTVFSDRIGNALEDDPEDLYVRSKAHRDDLACSACLGCSHDVTLYLPTLTQARDRLASRLSGIRR